MSNWDKICCKPSDDKSRVTSTNKLILKLITNIFQWFSSVCYNCYKIKKIFNLYSLIIASEISYQAKQKSNQKSK